MASNQTANYGLNQWAAEDQVLREEFNADNEKIDAAIWAARKAPCCVTGSYVGGTNPEKVEIELGFRPSFLVIIAGRSEVNGYNMETIGFFGFDGIFLNVTRGSSTRMQTGGTYTDSGFSITSSTTDQYGLNYKGITYYYAAFH